MQAEATAKVNESSRGERKIWDRMMRGIDAYLDVCLEPAYARIVRQGDIEFEDIDLLGRMVDAMICKVALLLPEAKNPKKLRERSLKIINSLLEALRT